MSFCVTLFFAVLNIGYSHDWLNDFVEISNWEFNMNLTCSVTACWLLLNESAADKKSSQLYLTWSTDAMEKIVHPANLMRIHWIWVHLYYCSCVPHVSYLCLRFVSVESPSSMTSQYFSNLDTFCSICICLSAISTSTYAPSLWVRLDLYGIRHYIHVLQFLQQLLRSKWIESRLL